jgi:Domain of unknown function (DUF4390)
MTEDRESRSASQRAGYLARFCMRFYKNCFLLSFCLLSSVLCPLASAEGISVNKAEARLNEDGYRLLASYNVNLTLTAQQALTSGVPLYFVGEFLLTRSRWYWLDEEVFQGEQTLKLSYNVLTRQYRISRGALFQNFASFDDALNILARQSSTAIPAERMKKNGKYTAAVRLRLNVEQLPLPLQVNALTSKDWFMNSDWYSWVIRPSEINVRFDGKAD